MQRARDGERILQIAPPGGRGQPGLWPGGALPADALQYR